MPSLAPYEETVKAHVDKQDEKPPFQGGLSQSMRVFRPQKA